MNFHITLAKTKFVELLMLCLFACAFFPTNGSSQNPRNFEEFAKKLASGSVEEKRDVLYSIRNIQTEKASRVAVPALTDVSEIVRVTAVASVVFLEKDEASRVLLPLLNDQSSYIRRETAYAMGKIRSVNSLIPLIKTLRIDKTTEVRAAAAIALGQIGDLGAIKSLSEILEAKPKSSETFLRRSAALSIGQIARNLQIRAYAESYSSILFDNANWEAMDPEYENLSRLPGFQFAVDVLIKMLQNNGETNDSKREAAFALGEIGDHDALEALQKTENSEDLYLAEISMRSSKNILSSKSDPTTNE